MLNIGGSELLVTALIALLVLRPRDIPDIMRSAAMFFAAIRRLLEDARFYLVSEGYREQEESRKLSILDGIPPPKDTPEKHDDPSS